MPTAGFPVSRVTVAVIASSYVVAPRTLTLLPVAVRVVDETALSTVKVTTDELDPEMPVAADGTKVAVICSAPAGVLAGTS